MNNSGKQQSFSDREVDDQQQSNDDLSSVSGGTGEVSSAAVSGDSITRRNGNNIGLAARLTDLFVGDGDRDNDLLMQRNTQEGTVMQWLQALDMQVIGACRADERLKPLLKLDVSSVAEDRLLSHLSQHFEPSEVGLLARCLCIPLVSIRVGKISKQGTRLIPTSARGNLVLSLLPTSDLRISFLGDDGYEERLSILRNTSDCSSVMIEGIPADTSGRSFFLRVPTTTNPFCFWCSEKSKLLGNELLGKMRNLLESKPSLSELTGISNSRLERFVHHLHTFLVIELNSPLESTFLASTPSRPRTSTSIIQTSLSPRPSSFKEGFPKNLASLRNLVKDKSKRRVEVHRLLESSESSFFPSLSGTRQIPSSSSPNLFEIIALPLPPFLPLSMPPSQLFTPLMCDPIVHIPVVLDLCSSGGQAYLVSAAGPAMIAPLVQESDSEKSARDTLRLLLSGSSQFPQTADGTRNTIATMTLVSPMRRCVDQDDFVDTNGDEDSTE